MSSPSVLVAKYGPLSVEDHLSIPQFMTKYNPDNISADKLVHVDTIAGKSLTYGGLRTEAAAGAWGLRHQLGLKEGDVLSLLCPNSVRGPLMTGLAGGGSEADNGTSLTLSSCVMRHGGRVL